MERIILHCDLNSFYASVELLSHPELQHLPIAVCGDPKARHGIILAKNEPAKKFGVKTAETIWQARKKCPELILLPPHHDLYAKYSKQVNAIYEQFTDLVEPFGIDESWLDVTNTLHLFRSDSEGLAHTIRQKIKQELGLTISVGVSFNKVFAKLGSDYKKPDAVTVISRENWKDIVHPLPVNALLYVGHNTACELNKRGIKTIGDLAACSEEMLKSSFGKLGLQLLRYAQGLDHAPVLGKENRENVKSIGNSTTFSKDLTTWEELQSGISILSDSVSTRLRQHNLYCSCIAVGIRNHHFQTISRQKMLPCSTHLMREINAAALELLHTAWNSHEPVRLLSVTASHLTTSAETYEQIDLFASPVKAKKKQEKLETTMDMIRSKYGKNAISYANMARPNPLTETEKEESH